MSTGGSSRIAVAFTADGDHAACVSVDLSGRTAWERWTLTGQGPRRRLRVPADGDAAGSYALPVSGGRVLAVSVRGGEQQLRLLGAGGVLATRPLAAQSRLVPAPPGCGVALVVTVTAAGQTELHRCLDDLRQSPETLLGRLPTPLRRVALVAGDQVVIPIRRSGGRAWPGRFDPATGRLTELPLPPQVRAAMPVCAAGAMVLLAVSMGGGYRLALVSLGRPGHFEVLVGLDDLAGSVRPLAVAAGGEVLVRTQVGLRSRLLRHDPGTGATREVAAPAGTASLNAAWGSRGLWLPYATTFAPTGLWWLPPGGDRLRPAEPAPAGSRPGRVESFPGADGPVEAVVYGDWRGSDRLVIALHGGPAEHWSLSYYPLLQVFAQAGLAVIAPNQRGSTGYGSDHEAAIKGAWGGPDLADLVALGRHLAKVRGDLPYPSLYGTSYGAFLALLATAMAPAPWSGCVAVAPFLSGARLYPQANQLVRNLLDRLDGTTVYTDQAGPRDLLALAPRMRGRILLIHGDQDRTIPVSHSRELAAALAGRPAVTVRYRELAGRGHQPVEADRSASALQEILQFLMSGSRSVAARPG